MRTITKYELRAGESRVNIPVVSDIVCAINIEDKVYVAVEVDTDDKEMVERAFLVVRLGEEIKENVVLSYLGHVYLFEGGVAIVYEVL